MMYGFGYGMGAAGWIWMILGVAVFVAVVWWVARAASSPREPSETPADILRLRLARGEITPEEYEQARRTLGLS